MNTSSAVVLLSVVASLGAALPRSSTQPSVKQTARSHAPKRIAANDNRRPAGTLRDGKLELKLEVVNADWFPEAESGPSIVMQAFAEEGRSPEIPGPMIRVTEGTVIHVTIHNSLPDSELVVHGLHTRPATTDDILRIPAGATRDVAFPAGAPGTYFYWATTTKKPLAFRVGKDSQLSGAIIIDPKVGARTTDRAIVIGLYSSDPDSAAGLKPHPREITVLNGKSWPYTERFTFTEGDTVHWRVLNPADGPHPMHLHGFYFNVERSGGEGADTALAPSAISVANTRVLASGTTMSMHFVPDRPGNWLFHCHLSGHVDGKANLHNIINRRPIAEVEHDHASMNHGINEMAGLIIGIHVLPRGEHRVVASVKPPQLLRLLVQSSPHGYNHNRAIGFVLQQGAEPKKDSVTLPGPILILEKGRPARITIVNHLSVPTSVHWHGMEIESYPDGVAGWSGVPGRLAPVIQPADSFVAEFTPPRAGTFIYHSHVNEMMQTNSGMNGALIVTDSAHPFDPRTDKIVLVSAAGPGTVEFRPPGVVNGTTTPQMELEVGTTYRLRLIQIHTQAMIAFRLGTDTTVARWTPVAKDGADLPPEQSVAKAAYVLMGAGETGDFLYTPERPGLQKLSIQTRFAGWQIPLLIFVKPAKKVTIGRTD